MIQIGVEIGLSWLQPIVGQGADVTASAFIQNVISTLKKSRLSVSLKPSSVLDEEGTLAIFDSSKGIIVAAQHPDWLLHLAHEYGHFQQSKEGHPDWKYDPVDLEAWIDGRVEYHYADLEEIVRSLQRLEHDAERRALKHIRQHKLGDATSYARKANRYILSFEIARRYRVWPDIPDEYLVHFPARLMPLSQISNHPVLPHFRPKT